MALLADLRLVAPSEGYVGINVEHDTNITSQIYRCMFWNFISGVKVSPNVPQALIRIDEGGRVILGETTAIAVIPALHFDQISRQRTLWERIKNVFKPEKMPWDEYGYKDGEWTKL
jgi:hypothetical protein